MALGRQTHQARVDVAELPELATMDDWFGRCNATTYCPCRSACSDSLVLGRASSASLPRPHQSSSFSPVLDRPLPRLLVLTHNPFDHSLTIRALLALPEPLLHRAADAALGRKVLANGAGAVKWPADGLRRAADGAGACFYWKARVSDWKECVSERAWERGENTIRRTRESGADGAVL